MAAAGKRRNLTLNNFQKIANDFDIKDWRVIVDKTKEVLGNWQEIAEKYGVPEKLIKNIRERIAENKNRTS